MGYKVNTFFPKFYKNKFWTLYLNKYSSLRITLKLQKGSLSKFSSFILQINKSDFLLGPNVRRLSLNESKLSRDRFKKNININRPDLIEKILRLRNRREQELSKKHIQSIVIKIQYYRICLKKLQIYLF